jgi:hypothetical protein
MLDSRGKTMGALSDEMRAVAKHLEGAEAIYPEQSPGVPADELGAIYELVREIGAKCYRLTKAATC